MKIDIFTHLLPESFLEDFMAAVGPDFYLRNLPQQIPELLDISARYKLMDDLGIDKQVITLPTPRTMRWPPLLKDQMAGFWGWAPSP